MESEELEITEKDVMELMDLFTRVPPLLLRMVVSRNSNVVKSFQNKIEEYKDELTEEDLIKIKKVLEMPVENLQKVLGNVYAETHQEQLKILADPKAEPFIIKNLQELEKVMY